MSSYHKAPLKEEPVCVCQLIFSYKQSLDKKSVLHLSYLS